METRDVPTARLHALRLLAAIGGSIGLARCATGSVVTNFAPSVSEGVNPTTNAADAVDASQGAGAAS